MTTVIPLRARRFAGNPTTTDNTGDQDAIQLHAQAENALSMALFYMRQPVSNVPGAARKAVQALQSLNQLQGRA